MKKITNIEDGLVNANTNAGKAMTVLKVVVIGLLVLLLFLAGFITYLQLSTFDTMVAPLTLVDYASTLDDSTTYTEQGYVVDVPEALLATMLKEQLDISMTDTPYTIEQLVYEQATSSVHMNLTYYGFYLPVSLKVQFLKEGDRVLINADEPSLSKNQIEAFWPFSSFIKSSHPYKTMNTMHLDLSTLNLQKGLRFSSLNVDEATMTASFVVDKAMVQSVFDYMKTSVDETLIEAFEASDDLSLRKAAEWMTQVYPLSDEQRNAIINDLHSGQILTTNLLILTDDTVTAAIEETLAPFGIVINPDAIAMERKRLEGQQVDPVILSLLTALDTYSQDRQMSLNQGKPFDMDTLTTLSVKDVALAGGLSIEESILEKLTFVYHDDIGIAYELDDTTYYIRYENLYEMVGVSEYNTMDGAGAYESVTLVNDYDTFTAVSDYLMDYFQVEKVFIRYMKSDGNSYFVIASPQDEPQLYWNFALISEGGSFTLLDDNVKYISELHEAYPMFNIETATYAIEETKLLKFGDDVIDSVKETILQEMYELGKITHPSNHTIDYLSFDGKYIAFMIGTGKEYVYKVDGTHLQTVYTKDKAVRNWPDIPEIILLQEIPEQ